MPFNQMGFGTKTQALNSTPIALQSGQAYTLPTGQYQVVPGAYTFLQWFDPTLQNWRQLQTATTSDAQIISSDGYNYRLYNGTGTVAGAVVTNGGTGYTNGIYTPAGITIPGAVLQAGTAAAPSVTIAAGGGTVVPTATLVVGGAVNATLTLAAAAGLSGTFTAGQNYTRAPNLIVSAPPPGGVPCTMVCAIGGGTLTSVTVTNVGAGYLTAPTVSVVNHTLDTTGTGATVTPNATLTNANQIVAIVVQNGGVGLTSVPALTFSPPSTTLVTAIMCWTCTSVTLTGPTNAGNGNMILIGSTVTAGVNTTTNPAITTGLVPERLGFTAFGVSATPTTAYTIGNATVAQQILDGGIHQTVPNAILINNSNGTISGATTTTILQGGTNDISYIMAI